MVSANRVAYETRGSRRIIFTLWAECVDFVKRNSHGFHVMFTLITESDLPE